MNAWRCVPRNCDSNVLIFGGYDYRLCNVFMFSFFENWEATSAASLVYLQTLSCCALLRFSCDLVVLF